MATLHFLALEDVLESTGERGLHGTGRRWSILTTNSVAKLSKRESPVVLCLWVFMGDPRKLPKAPNTKSKRSSRKFGVQNTAQSWVLFKINEKVLEDTQRGVN